MIRGTKTFVCDDCGHKFKGMDIEWCATALSQPMKCPNCGSYHTCPDSFLGLNKIYLQEHLEADGRGSQSSKRPPFNS